MASASFTTRGTITTRGHDFLLLCVVIISYGWPLISQEYIFSSYDCIARLGVHRNPKRLGRNKNYVQDTYIYLCRYGVVPLVVKQFVNPSLIDSFTVFGCATT